MIIICTSTSPENDSTGFTARIACWNLGSPKRSEDNICIPTSLDFYMRILCIEINCDGRCVDFGWYPKSWYIKDQL